MSSRDLLDTLLGVVKELPPSVEESLLSAFKGQQDCNYCNRSLPS